MKTPRFLGRLKNAFRAAIPGTEENSLAVAKRALDSWGVKYEVRSYSQFNTLIYVDGNINLSNKSLTKLPDLSLVVVKGDFNISHNRLTNLEGAPLSVQGLFDCSRNELISVQGLPFTEKMDCSYNKLDEKRLAAALRKSAGDYFSEKTFFNCKGNLASIEEAREYNKETADTMAALRRVGAFGDGYIVSTENAAKYTKGVSPYKPPKSKQ